MDGSTPLKIANFKSQGKIATSLVAKAWGTLLPVAIAESAENPGHSSKLYPRFPIRYAHQPHLADMCVAASSQLIVFLAHQC